VTTAIGFDLGDTLIRYEGVPQSWSRRYREAIAVAAASSGHRPSEIETGRAVAVLERYNTRLAPRVQEVCEREIFGEVTVALGFPAGDCRMVADAFFNFYRRQVTAYPETIATLRQLKCLGVEVGVLTDVPYGMERTRVEADLAAVGIDGLVSVLLTSVEVGARKPAPVGFARLASDLGVEIGDLIYIGNEEKDIEGANGAGARSVLIDREELRPGWGAWAHVKRLDEIFGLLCRPCD
jgi:putative hydrolase of the HAD superfamily